MSNPSLFSKLNRDGIRCIVRDITFTLIHLAVLLIAAGKFNWSNAWGCIGLSLSYQVVGAAVLMKLNPQLLNKRWKLLDRKNTKPFDKIIIVFHILIGLIASVIPGIDAVRYGWSTMSSGVIVFGIVLFILTSALGMWAMAVNPHAETTVLIQDNHKVCTAGPYKIVRHPLYAAFIMGAPGYPLILGSWWGLVPVAALVVLFVIRTALEDRTLQLELPGYMEYTKITRYRLIPFMW